MPDAQPPPLVDSPKPSPDLRPPPRKRRLLRLVVLIGVGLMAFGAAGLGGAEYYTSRPVFCGSCHVMDPYYASWSLDAHGAKIGAKCVNCHYAPGEQHTIRAKFRGLSQAASYFSGRYGAGRPRAVVADASCLTSRCHGNHAYLDKSYLIGEPRTETRIAAGVETDVRRNPTVRFTHDKHLRVTDRLAEVERQIESLVTRLKPHLSGDALRQVRQRAASVQPAAARDAQMDALLTLLNRQSVGADAKELIRLEHARLRLRQLDGLNCSACHTYDAGGSHHFTVDRQACYTCHFTNAAFNHETGECLKCHQPPTRQIAVHTLPPQTGEAAANAVLMDHQDIVRRGIDCASCHFDVVQGDAVVTARDCTHCHDQARFLEGFEQRTTETVAEYHRVHVANQHARCNDCHRAVKHQLIDAEHVASATEFLKPVLDDCRHCHANHHREQVQLLTGTGGAGIGVAMPNAMFGSRINCRACHTQGGEDVKGDAVVEATGKACVACHGEDYERMFQQWRSEIAQGLAEAEASLGRVNARVVELTAGGRPPSQAARDRIDQARQNVALLKAGNGIHNKNYALQLLDLSLRDLDASMAEMTR